MEPREQSSSIDLRGRRILVVDDDRLNVRILSNILKSEGYTLADADSGERALEVYESFHPDLILLDVMMPGMNGFETCRSLRQRYGGETAPVIFITAKSESDDVVEGLSAGGVDYLPKPFRAKEALARIRNHLHIRLLSEQQKSLVDQLSKANAAKNRFLGMAAHDLRNPLASIRGLAEFLRDGVVGPLAPEQLDLIKTIHEASQGMLDLVNELLDVATIESGELKLTLEAHNLTELIEKNVYLANIEAAKKHTKIVFAAPGRQALLPLDPGKINQVIANLLSNALKYSPAGSTITVELHHGKGTWAFSVKDQGPGIPENERDKLFKDFGRLSVKTTGGEKSTGLGLAICRKIVDAHRGTIAAENLPQRGCEFRVTLPS
ncbi:MAG TPA: hybrid sensor histidine kinase/response regulator [Opitutaceae bacterium]|nr:hybrid sensor histidine kinase/response regulator [Opitutaceae bacterium]